MCLKLLLLFLFFHSKSKPAFTPTAHLLLADPKTPLIVKICLPSGRLENLEWKLIDALTIRGF